MIRICRYCDGLIDQGDGVQVAYEHGNSGPGWEVWAHTEHAHLVRPDPAVAALIVRILMRRAGR